MISSIQSWEQKLTMKKSFTLRHVEILETSRSFNGLKSLVGLNFSLICFNCIPLLKLYTYVYAFWLDDSLIQRSLVSNFVKFTWDLSLRKSLWNRFWFVPSSSGNINLAKSLNEGSKHIEKFLSELKLWAHSPDLADAENMRSIQWPSIMSAMYKIKWERSKGVPKESYRE